MTSARTPKSPDTALRVLRAVSRNVLMPLVAGVVLAILAPFGTDHFSVPMRLAYWVFLTLAGGIGAIAAVRVVQIIRPEASMGTRIVSQTLGATLCVAPFVLSLFTSLTMASVGLSLFYIAVISVVIATVGELTRRGTLPADGLSAEPVRPPLMDRLPPRFRNATLHAVSSEDHYVRVHTSAGEHMMLMRLSDAQDLASPVIGVKPHRSWWVSEAGAEEIARVDGKLSITLPSGVRVPVSRSGAQRLRASGWLP